MSVSRPYSRNEEIFHSISHGIGILLAVVGTTIMITLSILYRGALAIVASSIYGFSLIVMYTMSTLYHAIPFPKAKRVFQILDHDSIYLLIAGSYTPITLIALKGSPRGLAIFIVVWIVAIVGIVLNAVNMKRFKKAELVLYLVMGWAALIDLGSIISALGRGGIILLIAGGVCYTVGTIFYKMKRVSFMHGIWHLFVVFGSVLHYVCILLFVL